MISRQIADAKESKPVKSIAHLDTLVQMTIVNTDTILSLSFSIQAQHGHTHTRTHMYTFTIDIHCDFAAVWVLYFFFIASRIAQRIRCDKFVSLLCFPLFDIELRLKTSTTINQIKSHWDIVVANQLYVAYCQPCWVDFWFQFDTFSIWPTIETKKNPKSNYYIDNRIIEVNFWLRVLDFFSNDLQNLQICSRRTLTQI